MKKKFEFGLSLLLVILVFAFCTNKPFFETRFEHTWFIVLLLLAAGAIAVMTAYRQYREPSLKTLWFFGTSLFILGSLTFLVFPEYFTIRVELPMPFWYRLSFYAMPSICFEGAVVTYMIIFDSIKSRYVKRYQSLLEMGFLFYIVSFIGASMLVVGGIITVASHMHVAWIVITIIGILATSLYGNVSKG